MAGPVDLTKFPDYDTAAKAFQASKSFAKLDGPKRVDALHEFRRRYNMARVQSTASADIAGRFEAPTPPPNPAPEPTTDPMMGAAARSGQAMQASAPGTALAGAALRQLPIAGPLMQGDTIQAGIDAAVIASLASGAGEAEMGAGMVSRGIAKLPDALRPLGRFSARVVPAIMGGAAGGAVRGGVGTGATRGGVEAVSGEATYGIVGAGSRTLQSADAARLNGWLSHRLPIKPIRTVGDFDKAFRGGEVLRSTEKVVTQADAKASKILGSVTLVPPPEIEAALNRNPQFTGMPYSGIPFDEAIKVIDEVNKLGWDYKGDPVRSHLGKAIRSSAHQMEDDIAQQLDAVNPKIATEWYTRRHQLGLARTMTNLMSEPGVIDRRTGKIVMEKIQELSSEVGNQGYRQDLHQTIGPNEADSFLKSVFAGAEPTKTNRPGQIGRRLSHSVLAGVGGGVLGQAIGHPVIGAEMGTILGGMMGGHDAGTWALQFPRHVGYVPYNLGRNRALFGATVLGPYRFAQALSDSLGINETPEQHQQALRANAK
jgi:hypothetical protein